MNDHKELRYTAVLRASYLPNVRCFVVPVLSFASLFSDEVAELKYPEAKRRHKIEETLPLCCN